MLIFWSSRKVWQVTTCCRTPSCRLAKDKQQQHNKHYQKAGQLGKVVANRPLIKVTCFYEAQFIVDLIASLRKKFNLTPETFKGRVAVGNAWSSAVFKPLMEEYFPKQYQKAHRHGWDLGSHFGRKLYGAASFKIYAKAVRIASGETIGKQTWLSIILGHAGGILTQLSYDVIEWDESIDPNDLKMPNDELVRELQHEMLFYRKEIVKMSEQVSSLFETQKKYEREIANLRQAVGENSSDHSGDESNDSTPRTAFATFKKKNGSFVTIKKAPNMKKWSEDDKQTVLNELAEELQKNGLAVNTSTMRQLGLGAETVAKFKQRENKPRAAVPQQEQKQTAGDVSVAPPTAQPEQRPQAPQEQKKETQKKSDKQKQKGNKKQYETLKEGEKIVSGALMQRTLQTKSNISEM